MGIIHLAGIASTDRCLANVEDCWDINLRGTELLLHVLEERHVGMRHPWILYASTGDFDNSPYPTQGGDMLSSSIMAAEEAIERYVVKRQRKEATSSLHAISLRIGVVYGAQDDWEERCWCRT